MPLPLTLILSAMLFPIAAFALLVAAGRRMGTTLCGIVGTLASLAAFATALIALMVWLNGGVWSGEPWGAGKGPVSVSLSWSNGVPFGLYADSLTIVFIVGGLLISSAIHIFTTGYLRHDIRGPRIFALLALADASVVGLLSSASLPQWAAWATLGSIATYLVAIPVPLGPGGLGITPVPRGLTSADLTQRASAALAMLLLRSIGDACLLLACAALLLPTLFALTPDHISELAGPASLAFADLWFASALGAIPPAAPWLLIAAATFHASALPAALFLPDTKGSPTPAAGLAYAFTMLPAGPLLLIRIFPTLAETHLLALSILGGLTLISAALFAIFESDLRRLLAWLAAATAGASLVAIGAGSPGGVALHLIASMFALSILLLASGSVLHACMGERRLWHYGGLFFRMPASALLFAHGAGTLLGGPLLAGSSSWSTLFAHAYRSLQSGQPRGYIAFASLTLGLTGIAVAIARCWALLFLNTPRDRVVYAAARESATLSVPVAILALVATVVGSAVLSPVRQLIAVLPTEMSAEVARTARSVALSPARPFDVNFPLWRDIPTPALTPQLPPSGEDDLTPDTAPQPLPVETPTPPDTRVPRAINPIRWSIALAGAVAGFFLARRIRGSFESRRREVALAHGLHLSSFSVGLTTFLGQSLAALLLVFERLLLGPIFDALARVVLPFGRLPTSSPAAALASRQAAPRTALLTMCLFAGTLVFALAFWALSHLPLLELHSPTRGPLP